MPVGYVVQVENSQVILNLLDQHRGQMASHSTGVSSVTEIGGMIAIDGGHRLLVLKITGLSFAEPKEVHRFEAKRVKGTEQPLRNIRGIIVGWIESIDEKRQQFFSDNQTTPSLGAGAYPLLHKEIKTIVGGISPDKTIILGTEYRTGNNVNVGLNSLLAQHVAVVGSTGQGKSCFTAAILQQLADLPKARIVVFDINGEYDRAFRKSEHDIDNDDNDCRLSDDAYKQTVIGESTEDENSLKIPYYALGRHGLHRLLLPSEKTQRPALTFAIDNLHKVKWDKQKAGASLVGGETVLFDDCRTGDASSASEAINKLRNDDATEAEKWPHMRSLAALVAESHSIEPNKNGMERNAFKYGNISPLITRIHRYIDDEMFCAVVDVSGGDPSKSSTGLNWQNESESLVDQIFGNNDTKWNVHVVNLRNVPQDLMPIVLGSLLELYAYVLFRRGQDRNPATLLVLEEAHHYLRSISDTSDTDANSLAYERLAKEGRKFGLSLWLSTQRPSEVSATVLSQCNNWISFRLNAEKDLRAIASACDWADPHEVKQIAGLARQNAMVLGGCVAIPTRIRSVDADPRPMSMDPPFESWAEN